MINKIFLIFVFFYIGTIIAFSQNLDSILVVARNTKNDSVKIRLFNKIGFSYIFNDTNKALKIIKEGKNLAIEKEFNFGLTELTNTHGIYFDVVGKSDSAKYYFTKALSLSKIHNIKNIENMCLNNLGMFNWNRGNYNEALDYFFQSLRLDDKSADDKASATPLNNIGLIYQEMNLYEKALEYHEKSLKIRKKYNLKNAETASLNNIGICYKSLGKIDEAIKVYQEGIDLTEETNNLLDYYKILENLANAYQLKEDYNKAIETYLKALDKPNAFQADIKSDISTYGNMISAFNALNNPKKGLFYANKGFELLKKYPKYNHFSADLFLNAAESNYMLNNFKLAREFTKKHITIKDSIFSENNAKAIADLEIEYETEKKEKEIQLQRADLAEKQLNLNRKNTQLIGLVILAVILSILGYLLYNQQKLKNHQLKKEGELKEALIKIETQNRLQEQRLRISRDLHDNIGAQLTFIISSIENLQYGFKIKNEKLTNKLTSISAFTKETIYELRDTIWAMNKSAISLEDLQARISNFVDKADISSSATRFNFNIDKSFSKDLEFTSVKGMNIYRIIQEAMNNALKYAEASKVNVHITKTDEHIQFLIEDNGNGFNENEVTYGNGISNMKKRAKEIGANMTIKSSLNVGTRISIILPL